MLSSIHLKMREAEVGMLMFVVCFGGGGFCWLPARGAVVFGG